MGVESVIDGLLMKTDGCGWMDDGEVQKAKFGGEYRAAERERRLQSKAELSDLESELGRFK